jgi:DNA-binding NarL/FixJ family response regulator
MHPTGAVLPIGPRDGSVYGNRVPTAREYRIIELVAQGLNNREVADAIGTTDGVVKNCMLIIYDKLGMYNRVELALWYISRKEAQ